MTRNAAILIAVAALIAGYMFLIEPLGGKRAAIRAQLAMDRETLAKQQQFIARVKDGGAELKKAMRELEQMERSVIEEPNVSLAQARLQDRVQDLAEGAALTVTSVRPLQPVAQEHYSVLPIYMESIGTVKQLSAFLSAIDNAWEMLAVDKLSVTVTPDGTLRVRAELSGLVKK